MKITQLMLAKGFGGAERYFVDLSLALAESGHEVQVICHHRFQEIDRFYNQPSIAVEAFSVLGWWDLLAHKRIEACIKQFDPRVVHAHLARGAYVAGRACTRLNIPLLVKTHNYVDLKYYRNVDRFIATTESQKAYLLQQGIEQGSISVVPNFSSLSAIEEIKATHHKPLQFVSYGRLVKKKGFHVLLDAMKGFLEQGHEGHLTIGGNGPEQETLMSQCKALQLENFVTFPGWVADVTAFLKDKDIFVLPSLDEPFGIAVLEAMALGKPIIATNTQGPREILNQETAFLVEPNNVEALAAMMKVAAQDEQDCLEKAGHALRLFKQKYSKEVVVSSLLALYQSQSIK